MFECHSGIRNFGKKAKGPFYRVGRRGIQWGLCARGADRSGGARAGATSASPGAPLSLACSARFNLHEHSAYYRMRGRFVTHVHDPTWRWSWRQRALPSAYNARSSTPARASSCTLTKLIRRTTITSPATVYVIRIVMNDSTNIMNSFIPHLHGYKLFIGVLSAYFCKITVLISHATSMF